MSPKRIQRKRTKGWRMPKGAVYVGRPTKWQNPFRWQDYKDYDESQARYLAVWLFRDWLDGKIREFAPRRNRLILDIRELRDKDLVCWCPLGHSCHADVLLEIASK
jgi:hypothetical protein